MAISHPKTWHLHPETGLYANSGDSWEITGSGTDGQTYGVSSTKFTAASGAFTSTLIGRTININNTVYDIVAVPDFTELTLDRGYTAGTNRPWCIGGTFSAATFPNSTLSGGDTIKFAKTEEVSIGNATWTNGSSIVTLETAQTQNIEDCNEVWTGAENVNVIADKSYYKYGTSCMRFQVLAGFTTGTIAYKAIDEVDLSAYTKISFWLKTSANITTAMGLKIVLYSGGATPVAVDTFTVPINTSTSTSLFPLVIEKDGGGYLGSSITGIAITVDSDPGAPLIYVDHFIACNDLNLCSLLKPEKSLYDSLEDTYYGIQSINGTTIILDNGPITKPGDESGWSSSTVSSKTVETKAMSTIMLGGSLVSSYSTYVTSFGHINGSMSLGFTTFSGGWNPSTDEQDGLTFIDGKNGYGYGLELGEFSKLENFGAVRFWSAYIFNNDSILNNVHANNNGGYTSQGKGIYRFDELISAKNIYCCNNYGTGCVSSIAFNELENIKFNNNSASGLLSSGLKMKISNSEILNNGTYGISQSTVGLILELKNHHFEGNVTASIEFKYVTEILADNVYWGDTTDCNIPATPLQAGKFKFISTNHNKIVGSHSITALNYTIEPEETIVHTEGGISWKFSPTNITINEDNPIKQLIATVAVAPGATPETITATIYVRRSSTNITTKLVLPNGQCGITTEVSDTAEGAIDTWEQLSVSAIPTQEGVLEYYIYAYGGTTYSVYVDDFEVSQE